MPSIRVTCSITVLLSGLAVGPTMGQAIGADTVTWSAHADTSGATTQVILDGTVQPGWHVYGLKQSPVGPTPLLVTLDEGAQAGPAGTATGSPAVKFHDPAFGVETQYYDKPFRLSLPITLKPGAQAIPLSLRFQTCNGRICQPPKTVHLSAAVTAQKGG